MFSPLLKVEKTQGQPKKISKIGLLVAQKKKHTIP